MEIIRALRFVREVVLRAAIVTEKSFETFPGRHGPLGEHSAMPFPHGVGFLMVIVDV